MSFIVAPSALLSAALAPMGFAQAPLTVMAGGLDLVRAVGEVFAARPEAVLSLPAAPASAFVCVVFGLTWLFFWSGALRWLGLAGILFGAVLYAAEPRPVVWADGDLRAVVARTSERWVAVGDARRIAFARGRLSALAGLSPLQADALAPPDGCDQMLCAWKTPAGRPVLRVLNPEAVERACQQGALVLSDEPLPDGFARRCGAAFVTDPVDLARMGGLSIAEGSRGLVVRRARDGAGFRPWSGVLRRSDG